MIRYILYKRGDKKEQETKGNVAFTRVGTKDRRRNSIHSMNAADSQNLVKMQ